jgi:hypothetical protein
LPACAPGQIAAKNTPAYAKQPERRAGTRRWLVRIANTRRREKVRTYLQRTSPRGRTAAQPSSIRVTRAITIRRTHQ